MLASPEPTAEAIWARFAEDRPNESVVYVEDKFDGIRAQLHRGAERVELFSRDLRRVTGQFDEIAERARGFADEVILDGEIMAFEHGKEADFFRPAKTARTQERERRSLRRARGRCAGCLTSRSIFSG